ncbi:hypothetical protein F0562_023894 [Nyssa sinensis]|uniref:Uncharacterized protein n=1 Tax=Nyssa sinensis TaxID=561372 RepID=A0A5J5BLZ4_9ASTE|nr:hypothetical protein F0562_023894 [Nyssa sinensis]
MALIDGSSSEKMKSKGISRHPKMTLLTMELSNSLNVSIADVVGTSNLPMLRRGKKVVTPNQRGDIIARALEERDPPLLSMDDALRWAWELSWGNVPSELAQFNVTQAIYTRLFISWRLFGELDSSPTTWSPNFSSRC